MSAPARRPVEVLRNLPIDIDNEKNLIWCLLRKPELLRDDSLSFSVEDFHFGPHCLIAQAIIDLDNEGVVPDPGMIANRLIHPSEKDYLLDLTETMWASPSNARYYAEKLREVASRRRAIFDADKLNRAANSGVPEDIARVYGELAKREDPDESEFPVIRPSRFQGDSVEDLQQDLHFTGRVFFQVMELPEGIENQKVLAGSCFDDLSDELFIDRRHVGQSCQRFALCLKTP